MMQLTDSDAIQLEKKGISKEKVRDQIETFEEGIPFVNLEKAAVVGDGIYKFSEKDESLLIKYYNSFPKELAILKFVPASGAASRMFKVLFNFLDAYNFKKETFQDYAKRTGDKDMLVFANGLTKFPFYEKVKHAIKGKANDENEELYLFVQQLLSEEGFNYGFFPKGLLPFHDYADFAATPFEEHLKESAMYAQTNGNAKLHFTISEQHKEMFLSEYESIKDRVTTATKISYVIDYSYQKSATDTLAVDMDNKPFRNSDGSLLFRPGGHGALIENLNEQQADVIFVKNIDNVVVPKNVEELANSKKILTGVLLQVQQKAFKYAEVLESSSPNDEEILKIRKFLEERLNVRFIDAFNSYTIDEKIRVLKDKINRPIRVCGMVKNEGEPGGGPFWIRDTSGRTSLQIVESAQIDMKNEEQASILKNATHFNPVDLVCGVKNYKGEKYNLLNYVDSKQGFITEKTKEGRELKALELPGLWNGAMAYWNTIFVEVPLLTFNPVKTVNDLLKPSHQV
ncbi:DUF4301 family protein [uncultured Maribacter sp.]|uniref:DUF4301 family protein n=1 Tax=uncultured Maribacter sp. TaxID=431308 RepID=UPI00260F4A18|nr:DUF4301 family protein [uncultured Maribacter sp.]